MVTKYAQTVTEQYNPNTTPRNRWSNVVNIIGDTDSYATAEFTREQYIASYKEITTYDKNGKKIVKKVADKYGYKNNHPEVLAGHDFRFDIPNGAYIKSVKFQVEMKVSNNVPVTVPKARFNIYGTAYQSKLTTDKSGKTGFHNGVYIVVPSKKIATSWTKYTYTMDREAIETGGISATRFNKDGFGVDLNFFDADWDKGAKKGKIFIRRIKCIIDYEVPNPVLFYENPLANLPNTVVNVNVKDTNFVNLPSGTGTESDPFVINQGRTFELDVHVKNDTLATGDNIDVQFTYPWGCTRTVTAIHGSYNTTTDKWNIRQDPKSTKKLKLELTPLKAGDDCIIATINDVDYKYYIHINPVSGDYSEINVTPLTDFRLNTVSCSKMEVKGNYNNPTVPCSVVCNTGKTKSLELDLDNSSNVESISNIVYSNNDATVSFNVNLVESGDYYLAFNHCCYPSSNPVSFNITIGSITASKSFSVLNPYQYKLDFKGGDKFKVLTHRVSSDLDTNATIIPCVSDSVDANMIVSDCRINMSIWDELDYIGCIPLEQTHFNPKSTFKDTLINSTYKNKRYMGKKLAVDEDITLNVRLHPHQVTTLQGLIEMDKPIPINANHKCFEGDSLNHRGWAEVYAVKTEQTGNNPHWYKCDIDVKYLTHNLNTRFNIDKGTKVNDYDVPSLLSETFANGEDLSGVDAYFNVDTDGTFYYSDSNSYEDDEENTIVEDIPVDERNNFTIDNGQHITITSDKPLSHTSQVAFTWKSTLLAEERENHISRIVRLFNKTTGKLIFDYEYDNIEISDDSVTADIIYRLYDSDSNVVEDVHDEIRFVYTPSDESLDTYGSTLHFNINNSKLTVIDEGFNGKEVYFENIQLVDTDYTYQVEWINKNSDAETNEVDCLFDFQVQDTILTSTYADTYGKLVVSPFPVANKDLLFTREADEGTIFYYKDDGEEFSYLIEPYYQYMNGTDLVTSDGVSVFDLNYGYEIIYIQNGLVRLGFNRLTGSMYLGKYDPVSDEYVTTHNLRLEKYDDINVNSISDDKIEIQASDCVFTIYRGHPYIKIKHELEDIWIDSRFNRVWAEQVGNEAGVELPAYWDLLNDANMFSEDVGGINTIKTKDVTISDEENTKTSTSLSFSSVTSDNQSDTAPNFSTDAEITFTLSDTALTSYTDVIDIDDTVCSFGSLEWIMGTDGKPYRVETVASKDVIQSGDTTSLYGKVYDCDGNPVSSQTVKFYEQYTPNLTVTANPSVIQSGSTSTITAKLKDGEDGSAIAGERVKFYAPVLQFRDSASSDGSSDYTQLICENNATGTLTFNTNKYDVTTNQKSSIFKIDEALPTNCIIQADVMQSAGRIGVGIVKQAKYVDGIALSQTSSNAHTWRYDGIGFDNNFKETLTFSSSSEWLTVVIEKTGTSLVMKVKDGDTVLGSVNKTMQFSASDTIYAGVLCGDNCSVSFKNLIIREV